MIASSSVAVGRGVVQRGAVLHEQRRGGEVDPLVGALRRQDGGHRQLQRVGEVELAVDVRKRLRERAIHPSRTAHQTGVRLLCRTWRPACRLAWGRRRVNCHGFSVLTEPTSIGADRWHFVIPLRPSACLLQPCVVVARRVHSRVADAGNLRAGPTRSGPRRRHGVADGRRRVARTGQGRLGAQGARHRATSPRPGTLPLRETRPDTARQPPNLTSWFADTRLRPPPAESAISADSTGRSCVALARREVAYL